MDTTGTRDDDAVSPVIGVILMIAITILLATVVGQHLGGIGEELSENPRANLNHEFDGDELDLTVTTLSNSDYVIIRGVEGLNVTGAVSKSGLSGSEHLYLDQTGTKVTLTSNTSSSVTLAVVAIKGKAPPSFSVNSASDAAAVANSNPPGEPYSYYGTVQTFEYDFG